MFRPPSLSALLLRGIKNLGENDVPILRFCNLIGCLDQRSSFS